MPGSPGQPAASGMASPCSPHGSPSRKIRDHGDRLPPSPKLRAVTDTVSVERLVRLGLTLYEARAYVALVSRDASTPAEIARLAGVPRPRIYDVLESLVGKGLAADRPGHTAKYVAMPPERAAGQLMHVHREHVTALEDD